MSYQTSQINSLHEVTENLLFHLNFHQKTWEELRETLARTPVLRSGLFRPYVPLRRRQSESVFHVFFPSFLMITNLNSRFSVILHIELICEVQVIKYLCRRCVHVT